MYKLWCIFLMQLFNFTPLKRYDLWAGALALTLGGGARSWSATGLIESQSKLCKGAIVIDVYFQD